MAVRTQGTEASVDYRYFVCDLMSNELLAEIPFRSVSYSRSLTEAGTFTGDIAVTEDTYNLSLYENTLPARTALYVVRDGICVWGGIIWSREYSLIDKVLSVSASEFTSYLSRRVIWKTWNSSYEATAEVSDGIMTVNLSLGQYGFTVGEAVYIYWGEGYTLYNGYFEVLSSTLDSEDKSVITVPATYVDVATGNSKTLPNMTFGEDNPITVETRQDSYEFAKDLLRELNTDLFDFDFANDEIRPGIDLFNQINTVSRSSDIATITTLKKHELTPGQKVTITDVRTDGSTVDNVFVSTFDNSEAVVASVIDDYSFTYSNTGNDVSTTTESATVVPVYSFSRSGNVATIETSSAHGFDANNIVYLEDVSQTFDGYYNVYANVSSTVFQVVQIGSNIAKSYTDLRGSASITGASGDGSTVTITANNDFAPGDRVSISNVFPTGYNGLFTVQSASDTEFTVTSTETGSFTSGGDATVDIAPTVTRVASAQYGTFGEHSTLGDVGFDFTRNDSFSNNVFPNPVIRGYELKSVSEILEEYSTKPGGFEYRVDCEYDTTTGTFKKYFMFLPLIPASLSTYIASLPAGTSSIPASAYGADDYIFEYPGNVREAQFSETSEDAATRFFVQGKDSRLNSDASQPYSAASNHKLLRQGWPILDQVEDLDSAEETVLWKQASRLLEESVPPISTFTISVNGSANPKLGTYKPGDWCSIKLNDDFVSLRADSYLEQDYGTDDGVLVRKIVSYSVSVPDAPSYPEEVSLELITEPSIPISGVTILDGKPFNGN